MKHRKYNKLYAQVHGYFWLPCPLCGKEFGGHEWLPGTWEKPSHIPNDHGGGTGICPDCTKAGKGINYPPKVFYVRLDDNGIVDS